MHFRWLAVAVLSLCPLRALADNNDLFGLGPRAAAMGGAMVAESNDFSSAFYNPSLLVNSKDSNFGLSLQFYRPTASVEKVSGAADLDCTNCTPRDVVASSLGFVFPLGGKVKNRVAIGLAVTLPTSVFLRLSSPDRNLPYWYRYDSSPERFIVHVAAGIKLVDWLNVGIGVQSLSDLIGDGVSVKVDLFSKQVRTGQINSYLSTRIGPVFGLTLTPWKRLRLGASFRWEMKLEYQIPAKVDLEGIGALNLTIGGVTHYTPHTFQFGGSLDVLDNLTVTLDGEWMNWSAAPSPYMNVGIGLSGATLSALGLDQAFDIQSLKQATGFSDTLTGRLGVEWRATERFVVRAGAFYRPTMVPRQDAPGTNLLDGNAVGVTGGIGFNFADPLEIFDNPVKIDITGHGTFIMPRDTAKETTDTVPSYSYSARVGGLSVGIRYDY